eukprot:Rhum_TRINITY_DN15320_c6_g1::Rhum_TRINITY_DN15320_c6_g1_i2::g.151151::m.151151
MSRVLRLLAVLRCCLWTDARLVFSGYGKDTGCTKLVVYNDRVGRTYTSYAIASSGTVLRVTKLVGAQAPPSPMDRALSHVTDIPVGVLNLSPPLVDVLVSPDNEVIVMDRTGNSRHIVPNFDVATPNITAENYRLGVGSDTCVSFISKRMGDRLYTFACCNTLSITWRTAGGSFFAKDLGYECEKLVISGDGFVFGTPRDGTSRLIYFNASVDNIDYGPVFYFMDVPYDSDVAQGMDTDADGRVLILYRPQNLSHHNRYVAVCHLETNLAVTADLLEVLSDPDGNPSTASSGFAADSRKSNYSYYTTTAHPFASGFRNVATIKQDVPARDAAYEYGGAVTGLPDINANRGIFSSGEYLFVCTDLYQLLFKHSFVPLPDTATVTITAIDQTAVDTPVPETALPDSPPPQTGTPLTPFPGTTAEPTSIPTDAPTSVPTSIPTGTPTSLLTSVPTSTPTSLPTSIPTS